jgi:hypothetical protein
VTTFTSQVAASSDDAIQPPSGNASITTSVAGTFESSAYTFFGFRFLNVTIPAGATVSSATIQYYIGTTKSQTAGTGLLDCVNSNNAATFAAITNGLSGLTLTGNATTWSISAATATGFQGPSASFAAAVQAVVNLSGWTSGNALAVMLYSPGGGIEANEIEQWDNTPSDAAKISITYTASGPPGAPTDLALAYISPTSLGATWVQGSGTVTDSKIKVSTDASTFTTTDIGSAVTSYTLTGLTPNTPYYVEVSASNTSGDTYCGIAVGFTAATVSQTVTIKPSTDNLTTGWTNNGGGGIVLHSAVGRQRHDLRHATGQPVRELAIESRLAACESDLRDGGCLQHSGQDNERRRHEFRAAQCQPRHV